MKAAGLYKSRVAVQRFWPSSAPATGTAAAQSQSGRARLDLTVKAPGGGANGIYGATAAEVQYMPSRGLGSSGMEWHLYA